MNEDECFVCSAKAPNLYGDGYWYCEEHLNETLRELEEKNTYIFLGWD
jgi:hypothetical protein